MNNVKDIISIIAMVDLLKDKGIITEDEITEYVNKWKMQTDTMANGVYEHRIVCRGVPKLTDKEIKDLLLTELFI